MVYYYLFISNWRYDRADDIPQFILSISLSQQQILSQIHRILLPSITLISTTTLVNKESSTERHYLLILTMILFFLVIGTQLYFDFSTVEISQGQQTGKEISSIDSLLTRISESIGIYIALLLGIKIKED